MVSKYHSDEKEPGLLGEMADGSFGAANVQAEPGIFYTRKQRKVSETTGVSQKDSLKGSLLAKMGEFEHLLKNAIN